MSEDRSNPEVQEDAGPVAPDRPVVDGTRTSPAELRAEVARAIAVPASVTDAYAEVATARAEVGRTVAALAERLDIGSAVRARGAAALALITPTALGVAVVVAAILIVAARTASRAS